jgi:SAM-dependent methyltransferase
MSLGLATFPGGRKSPLRGSGPFPAVDLVPFVGEPFLLPCGDPRLREVGRPVAAYLDGARKAWDDNPEYMDFLDEDSPIWDLKRAERDLSLHRWAPHLAPGARVLDLGCGIGRFTTWLLDRGASVWGVDGDLESLRRCAWHSAGRRGRLELAWTSLDALPDTGPLDAVLASEVLCYVPNALEVARALAERLVPGGAFLLSVEARYGWAVAEDAPQRGGLEAALGEDGVLDVPGDRWVQTYSEEQVRALLTAAGLEVVVVEPTHYLPDGPLERVAGETWDLEALLRAEERCRRHPVWGPLNRLWTAVGRRPLTGPT